MLILRRKIVFLQCYDYYSMKLYMEDWLINKLF